MHILKNRLKKELSNKIAQKQLTAYNILYIALTCSNKHIKNLKKKNLTKTIIKQNFNSLQKSAFTYPIHCISATDLKTLTENYYKLKVHQDSKNILITNFKINNFLFKKYNDILLINLNNPLIHFYKTFFFFNFILLNFIFYKKLKN